VAALDADPFYRSAFGATLVDYLVMMKRAEIRRYEEAQAIVAAGAAGAVGASGASGVEAPEVSDWEMREYFEFF
jgi:glutamine synthetase